MITKRMRILKGCNPPLCLAFKIASAQVSLLVFANKTHSTTETYR